MSTIEIVIPEIVDAPASTRLQLAPRHPLSSEARLTLIDNGKPKAREMLTMVAERLQAQLGIKTVAVFQKPAATRIISDEEAAAIAKTSDIVIAGLGDCGACSASSLGDAIRMEAAGVPSTVVITDVFTGNVAAFAITMGLPGYHSVAVPHPTSSKSNEQLSGYADAVVDQVVQQLSAATNGQTQAA